MQWILLGHWRRLFSCSCLMQRAAVLSGPSAEKRALKHKNALYQWTFSALQETISDINKKRISDVFIFIYLWKIIVVYGIRPEKKKEIIRMRFTI